MRHSSRARESAYPRSWLAIKGKSADDIKGELRLTTDGLPTKDNLSFQIVGAGSDAGWYLIVARGRDHRLVATEVVQKLSAGCEVLTCVAEEESIFSAAAGWRDGVRIWSVSYDGMEAPKELVAEGEFPVTYPLIRDRLVAEGNAEDADDLLLDPFYEIPIDLVHNIVNYKPEQPNPAFDGRFVELSGIDTPWYKRWTVGG